MDKTLPPFIVALRLDDWTEVTHLLCFLLIRRWPCGPLSEITALHCLGMSEEADLLRKEPLDAVRGCIVVVKKEDEVPGSARAPWLCLYCDLKMFGSESLKVAAMSYRGMKPAATNPLN